MDFITWTSTGMKMYLGDETVISLTYDELSVYLVILGVCMGLIIGLVYSYFTRIAAYRLTKALVSGEINTPEKAATLDELGVKSQPRLRRMLKSGRVIRRTILCANVEEMQDSNPSGLKKFWYKKFLGQDIPEKTDFKVARFYLPEENRIAAEVRYSREGMSPAALVITIIIILGVAVGAMFIVPELLIMTENVFGSSK